MIARVLYSFYKLRMSSIRLTNVNTYDAQRLYLDFDSFFASAEQHFNPTLRGRAVGVVPLNAPGTGCIAMSREAKALGVPSGATVLAARQMAPNMIFVVARPDAYVRLHHRILTAIESCVPIAKVRSIDEVVCHLLPSEAESAIELARRIKNTLAREFSDVLTCSIGIARTELLAKIAAEMDKPNGCVFIPDQEMPQKIAHLSLRDLPGVSKGIEARLHAANIRSVEALWATERKQARAIWGNVEGERFWNELHGLHVERPPTIKRMFGHSRNLPIDWRTPEKVRECARQLLLSAARRLRRTDKKASKMTVSMRGDDYSASKFDRSKKLSWVCELPCGPCRDDHALALALNTGMDQARDEVRFEAKSVSVIIHGLMDENEIQPELFAAPGGTGDQLADVRKTEKSEQLSAIIDQLRIKHGPSAANFGPKVHLPGGYLGAKIAFGRIPELHDFGEEQTHDNATHFYSC